MDIQVNAGLGDIICMKSYIISHNIKVNSINTLNIPKIKHYLHNGDKDDEYINEHVNKFLIPLFQLFFPNVLINFSHDGVSIVELYKQHALDILYLYDTLIFDKSITNYKSIYGPYIILHMKIRMDGHSHAFHESLKVLINYIQNLCNDIKNYKIILLGE
jgi:hypothetical protein